MTDSWDEEHDVIVVGSGAAAMAGAWQAARSGLSTVVLERTALLGGTSAYSGAACWLPGTEVQQRAGIADSTESARTYLTALLGDDQSAKREAFLATAPALVAQMEQDPAISFSWQPFPDYFDLPGRVPQGRSFMPDDLDPAELGDLADLVRPMLDQDRRALGHTSGPLNAGRALIGRLLLALHRTGNGAIRTEHSVDELIVTDGRVVGVVATTATGPKRIRAERGVLLAAGGFERNAEFRTRQGVPSAAAWSMAPPASNTGNAITAAVAVGADTDLMDQGWWAPGLVAPDGNACFVVGLHGALIVDQTGNRYANESLPYDQFGRVMAADARRLPSYAIFDNRTSGRFPAYVLPAVSADEHLDAGTWHRSETLEDLAAAVGLPVEALAQTVTRFNEFAAAGRDEDFGRGEDEFDKHFANPVLVPVDQGPFYAARLELSDLGTKGGLVTDIDSRVLRADGTAITGLYAAGNTSASWTGGFYPGPGIPIGSGMVFASRAIEHLTSRA